MNYGEFVEQPDGTWKQDRGNGVICTVTPQGFYMIGLEGKDPGVIGKCRDAETAKSTADSMGWEP